MEIGTVVGWLVALAVGALLGWVYASLRVGARYARELAAASAERDALRERVVDLEAVTSESVETAALVAPLASALQRVESQVSVLERDRQHQFGAVHDSLQQVVASTRALGDQTASLVGSLSSSSVRGQWGEVQLRRVLEHAGLLAHCDFDEQVRATTPEGADIRPDVVVRLPGGRSIIVDAKAPMSDFLAAQADSLTTQARSNRLRAHAAAVHRHIDALAAKRYWTGVAGSPELVIAFVPNEAVLTTALAAEPGLAEHALSKGVALASPATLLAALRTVAYAWQQDAVATNAAELLEVGRELYGRIGRLAQHADALGRSLTRSVETYNAFLGSLESRVIVTARRIEDLGLSGGGAADRVPQLPGLTVTPRPMTARELLAGIEEEDRPELDERLVRGESTRDGERPAG